MKRFTALFLALFALLGLLSCQDEPTPPEIEICTVIFDTGASPEPNIVVEAAKGTLISPWSVPAPEGYYHDGWFYEGSRWDFKTDRVEADITLTAGFTPITYVLWFDINGEPFASQEVAYREKAVKPEYDPIPAEGMRFVCWSYEGRPWDFDVDIVDGDIHLEAYFEPITEGEGTEP